MAKFTHRMIAYGVLIALTLACTIVCIAHNSTPGTLFTGAGFFWCLWITSRDPGGDY
jgi:hypothetical protein